MEPDCWIRRQGLSRPQTRRKAFIYCYYRKFIRKLLGNRMLFLFTKSGTALFSKLFFKVQTYLLYLSLWLFCHILGIVFFYVPCSLSREHCLSHLHHAPRSSEKCMSKFFTVCFGNLIQNFTFVNLLNTKICGLPNWIRTYTGEYYIFLNILPERFREVERGGERWTEREREREKEVKIENDEHTLPSWIQIYPRRLLYISYQREAEREREKEKCVERGRGRDR